MKAKSSAVLAAWSCAFALTAGAQEIPVVLFPFREATIASALDAELKAYHYKLGEPFTNGAVIAELDDSRYAVAGRRLLEHRDFTARIAKEQKELRAKDFASEMELRKAEYDARIAVVDYEEAELNLRRCRLVAPFNGKLAELLTQQYETVKPGQPLFRIIEDDRLLALANLPIGSVVVGDELEIAPEAGDAVLGRVYEVAPQADNRTGTVRVRVLIENAAGRLTAGMTGVVRLKEKPIAKVEASESETVDPELKKAREEAKAAREFFGQQSPEGQLDLRSPGMPFAAVSDAFSGVSPFVVVVDGVADWQAIASTNRPASWRGREEKFVRRSDGKTEVHAEPPLAITGIGFDRGVLAYCLHRYPRVVSLQSVKRVGELTAGIYDPDGKRLAHVEPRQVELPGAGGTVTNVLWFAPAEYLAACATGRPLKLIVRVESDVRSLDIPAEGGENGGR